MDKTTITTQVHNILTNTLGHDRFEMRDDLTAKDVDGWDSLTHMMIITGIEKSFDIKFKLRDLNKLKNMGSLLTLIEQKIS